MNKILSILAITASAAMLTGCDDYDDRYLPEYASVVRFDTYGEHKVSVWSTNQEETFEFKVLRSGHDTAQPTQAIIRTMTDDEWNNYARIYNLQSYNRLPDACFTFDAAANTQSAEINFTANKLTEQASVTFFVDKLRAYKESLPSAGSVIVLPLVLDAKNGTVLNDQKNLLILPQYVSPMLCMEPAGFERVSCTSSSAPYTRDFNITLNVENPWGFTVKVKNDKAQLDKYNAQNGTNYELMQPGTLEIKQGEQWSDWNDATIEFPKGATSAALSVRINPSKAGMMDALALCLTDPSINIAIDNEACSHIFAVAVKPDTPLSIKASDLTASNDDGENLVGNLIDRSIRNLYQSQNTPHDGDPVYGSYIDIKLPVAIRYFAFDFTSTVKNYSVAAVPSEVHVYASADGSTWEKCGEIKNFRKEVTRSNMRVYFGNYAASQPVNYLRWAVIKSGESGEEDLRANNTSAYWNAAMLSVYGK